MLHDGLAQCVIATGSEYVDILRHRLWYKHTAEANDLSTVALEL